MFLLVFFFFGSMLTALMYLVLSQWRSSRGLFRLMGKNGSGKEELPFSENFDTHEKKFVLWPYLPTGLLEISHNLPLLII